jgi:NAD(P)-dependent dehydrogenase (short-subunit alcohol dehydrogenase family)
MTMNLSGRVAIVTGSGANIGEACARALAAAGAQVVLADIAIARAEAVAQSINAAGGKAVAMPLDLAEEGSITALVDAVMRQCGRIDILHNNAADTRLEQMLADGSLLDLEAATWDRAFQINARGTMLMIKTVAPHMIANGGGAIINTSTGVSLVGDINNPSYSASKAAVNALTRNAAVQFGRFNIRVNAVAPGLVLSPLAREMMDREQIAMVQRHVLLPRESVPEDIAGTVLFLASDAASFITGQVIAVDGGIVHHTPYVADMLDGMSRAG